MNAIQKLEQAVLHGENFDDIATKIHDRFEAGAAELKAIYADVDTFVSTTLDKAKAAVATFKDGFTQVESRFEGTGAALEADAQADNALLASTGATLQGLDVEPRPVTATDPLKPEPIAPTTPETASYVAAVTTESPSGATVTVDPAAGVTTHKDDEGTTTVVPHDGSDATATNAAGKPVTASPDAVNEALTATADAGVTVSAAA